jgi:hypothetical protein
MGGGGDVFIGGEVGEEVADFVGSKIFGMAFVGVVGEALPNDADVGLFGAIGEISASHGASAFIEEGVEGYEVLSVKIVTRRAGIPLRLTECDFSRQWEPVAPAAFQRDIWGLLLQLGRTFAV